MGWSFPGICIAAGVLLTVLLLVEWLLDLHCRGRQHLACLEGKHVVITGGSSGIGLALAAECLSQGASVSLMARNAARLSHAASTLAHSTLSSHDRILLKEVDVTDAKSVSVAVAECFEWKPIDVLICNAGVTAPGIFGSVDVSTINMITSTNLLGCVYPMHAVLPLMKERSKNNPSSIVFMSSLSCLLFLSGVSMYSTTKYALKGLAETLRFELMLYNIKVSLVCPGFVETAMLDEADKADALNFKLMSKIHFYNRATAQSADAVARRTMEGVKRGEFLITTSLIGFLLGVLGRGFVPANSLRRACIELLLLVPARLASFVWYAYARRVLGRMQQPAA